MNIPACMEGARHLLIDSRKLVQAGSSIFFAFEGAHSDGHRFIPDLYRRGVRRFVAAPSRLPALQAQCPEACFWGAPPVEALQALAARHRKQFDMPVLGITGSNAKTIVKEWLSLLLEGVLPTVKSPKSYNSQVGVPLSVWDMAPQHALAIFEAGISRPGEMARLEAVIQPTLGLFTNIGPAHQEGFSSLEEKVAEKMRLFRHCRQVVYCHDHAPIRRAVAEEGLPGFSWGHGPGADWQLVGEGPCAAGWEVRLREGNAETSLQFPFSDKASVENALHCAAVWRVLGLPLALLAQRLEWLRPLPMRLELKEGARGCLLVDDAYSNDVAGLAAALEFLDQQDQHLPRLAILSDFPEIPEGSRQRAYEEVIALLRAKQVAAVWAVGPDWGQMPAQEGLPVLAFPHTDALLAYLQQHPPSHRAILVKGARVFALERATACLQRQHHGTRLEINLDALAHNFRFYKSLLPEGVRMMAMVKAFAYGSGSGEVARLLQYHRADYLAVAYADEGVALRDRGIGLPIMVMNPEPAAFEAMARHDLEPEIYSLRTLSAFLEASRGWAKVPAIHLKLNTGMNRLGFDEPDLPGLCRLLGQHPLRVASAFTHLAAADDPLEEDFTREQLGRYERMAALLQEALPQPFLRHALNSPGITRFPQACYDMVRLGIGLYGVDTNGFCQEQLRTVGTLKTHLSQVRPLRAGETVGYGRQGVMPRDGQIGVMAIGYADGFDRRLGNGVGKVLVKGQLAPVIGRVCMDMTMLDLTGIAAAAGDEVVVFGENPSLHAVAEALGTIPYEVLTSVGARVKRIYYSE